MTFAEGFVLFVVSVAWLSGCAFIIRHVWFGGAK